MENTIDLLIQLAFETGQAYQRIYDKMDLDNVINFNEIAFADSRGAQWVIEGTMENLPELFKIHNIKQDRINALNELAQQLQTIKNMSKQKYKVKEVEE